MSFIKYRKSVDKNQKDIVALAKQCHCSVMEINGVIDLILGFNGHNILVEVKNPDGKNRLQESQKAFMQEWKGQKPFIVRGSEDLLSVLRQHGLK